MSTTSSGAGCAPDESLTRFPGLAAVTELTERLGVIDRLDAAVGPIKTRDRGFSAGQGAGPAPASPETAG